MNFYKFYSVSSLDNESHGALIEALLTGDYTKDLVLIEHIIKKSPFYTYIYAKRVKRARWLAGEQTIMRSPYYSYTYATDVIKGRWKEAEPIIKTQTVFWNSYRRYLENTGKLMKSLK